MSSSVTDKFNELLEKGVQKDRELGIGGGPTVDTVWFSLLLAQSEIIVRLDDIGKMMSTYMLNRFERIDISEEGGS